MWDLQSKIWLLPHCLGQGQALRRPGSTKYRWLADKLAGWLFLHGPCLQKVRVTQTHQHMHFPRSKDGAAYHLHFMSIPYPGQGEKQCPGCQKGGCILEFLQCQSFSHSGSAWLVTWGSHDVILQGVWLPSLYPFWENKSQPGSPSPSVEAGGASSTTNSHRTGLEVADGIAVPLLQWSVALHNVITGWPSVTETHFSRSHFCFHLQPIVKSLNHGKLVELS